MRRTNILAAVILAGALGAIGCGGSNNPANPADAGTTGDVPTSGINVNGCTTFADHTATADARLITFTGVSYTPNCMHVSPGQTVTFMGTFASHPLAPGVVPGQQGTNPAGNPITANPGGTSATFMFPAAGVYPFFCTIHSGSGMFGAIQVL